MRNHTGAGMDQLCDRSFQVQGVDIRTATPIEELLEALG